MLRLPVPVWRKNDKKLEYDTTVKIPLIRARILALLSSAVPVLKTTESSLLPSVHTAWPFIVNRLGDAEPFVITEAANLIEALVINVGEYMNKRVWDDVWPRFKKMLQNLEAADAQSALARLHGTGVGAGARTAYSVSHRMYRALLSVMVGVVRGTNPRDELGWELALACRRFLSTSAHADLRRKAEELYVALGVSNPEMIWLVLSASIDTGLGDPSVELSGSLAPLDKLRDQLPKYLKVPRQWDIIQSVVSILGTLQ